MKITVVKKLHKMNCKPFKTPFIMKTFKKLSLELVSQLIYEEVSNGFDPASAGELREELNRCNEVADFETVLDMYGYDEPAGMILELLIAERK